MDAIDEAEIRTWLVDSPLLITRAYFLIIRHIKNTNSRILQGEARIL